MKMKYEDMDREACQLGLKTSAFIFFYGYGNAALNVTIYGAFFKLLGLLDVSWIHVFVFMWAPLVILGTILALHWMGKVLQFPATLMTKLIGRKEVLE